MKRPLAFVGFSMAITLLFLNVFTYQISAIVLVVATISFAISLLSAKLRQAKVAPLIFGAAVLACLVFMIGNSNANAQKVLDSHEARTVFHIVDNVEAKDDYYLYTVKTKSIDVPGAPQNIKLKLYSENEIDADYYEDVVGKIKYTNSFDNAFDSYGAYADSRYISASLESFTVSLNTNEKPINYYILKARDYIEKSITNHLKNDVGALCLALLTGNKSLLSDEVYSNFNSCGVTHIMAVSGLHTSVICMGIYVLLKNIGVKRNLRTFLSLFVLVFYMAIADFATSVIRSAIMIAVLLLARLVNKKADALNSLGLAVILICLNPFAVSDASAVLSVLSVLAMVVVKPKLDSFIKPKKLNKVTLYFYDGFALTFSIMITTFPAVWMFFKRITFVSYIANIILIPLAQLAMIGSLLVALFGFAKYLCLLPSVLTYVAAKSMILIADFLSSHLRFLSFDITDVAFIISYGVLLMFVGFMLICRKNIKIKPVLSVMFVLALISSFVAVYNNFSTTFLNITSTNAVVIYNTSSALVVGADSESDYYDVKNCLQKSKSENVLFVDCDYDNDKLSDLAYENKEFLNNCDFDVDLCDGVNVKYQSGIVVADVNGNEVIIDKKYVLLNKNLQFERKTKYIYDNDNEIVVSIRK